VTFIPPHNSYAERAVLGGALLDPRAAQLLTDIETTAFYLEKHRVIADAIKRLARAEKAVDLLTVQHALVEDGALDSIGGPAELAALADEGAVAANVEQYLGIVQERAKRREAYRIGLDLANRAAKEDGPPTDILIGDALTYLLRVDAGGTDDIVGPAQFAQELGTPRTTAGGLETSISIIDAFCGGLQPGNLFVLAGRPGTGKTSALPCRSPTT